MKKIIVKISVYVLAFILLTLVLTLAVSQTSLFRGWLRDKISTEINDAITGKVDIGDLEGNLFSEIKLTDITIENNIQDTLASIEQIYLKYNPLRLFGKEILVKNLSISGVDANIVQNQDSSWNIIRLFSGDTTAATDISETGSSFSWMIIIEDLTLSVNRININAQQRIFPQRVENLNLQLEGTYTATRQDLMLINLSAQSYNPDLMIREFRFNAVRDTNILTLSDFALQTGSSQVLGNAAIFPDSVIRSSASLYFAGDDLSDIALFIPQISLPAKPSITCDIAYLEDSLSLQLGLNDDRQTINADISIGRLHALFDPHIRSTNFSIKAEMNGLDSKRWYHDDTYHLTGNLRLDATGIYFSDRLPEIDGHLNATDVRFNGISVKTVSLAAALANENLTFDLEIDAARGQVTSNGMINSLRDRQVFDLNLKSDRLDLGGIWLSDSIPVLASGKLHVKGRSLDPGLLNGDLMANLSHLQVGDFEISELVIDASKQEKVISINQFALESESLNLECEGRIDTSFQSELQFDIDWFDIKSLGSLVPELEKLSLNGYTSGRFSGKPGDFSGDLRYGFSEVIYDSASLDSITGTAQFFYRDSSFNGKINTDLYGIRNGPVTIDRVIMQTDMKPGRYDITTTVDMNPKINMVGAFSVEQDSVARINISRLDLGVYGTHWRGGNENTWLIIADSSYDISDFELTGPGGKVLPENSHLRIDGNIDLNGLQDLEIKLENFNLAMLDSLFANKGRIEGVLNSAFSLSGSADQPEIKGFFMIEQGRLRKQNFQRVHGNIDLTDEILDVHTLLNINNQDSLLVSASVPVIFSLTNKIFGLPAKKGALLKLSTSGISLAVLMAGIPMIEQAQGQLQCDLTIMDQPSGYEWYGDLMLESGMFIMPKYGIDYQQIDLDLTVQQRRINLNRFVLETVGGGRLELEGFMDIDQEAISGGDLSLKADRFYVTKHKDYETQISADTYLRVTNGIPDFGGKIDLRRGNFYLPGILAQSTQTFGEGVSKKSLLMNALEAQSKDSSAEELEKMQPAEEKEPGFLSNFVRKLKGKLQLQFQKNVWLRSRDMRIELSGNLEVVQDQTETKMFGMVQIERGHYDVLGKRFEITRGAVTFRGKEEFNPLIDFIGEYSFRSAQKEKEYIRLSVQGELRNPQYQFYFNDTPISESEAVSYVLFGRSQEELSFSQQSDMASNVQGDITMGIVSNIVSDRLARSLGDDLKLDIIEVNARDNWKSATFLVGKYITEDLFLTYERSFGETEDNVLNPETISLEYQVTRSLYLQLIHGDAKVSGIDMFFKIEW